MNEPSTLLLRVAPAIFVMLWSTGWIVARAVAPYADPLTYLSARFGIAALVLTVFAMASRARPPSSLTEFGHMVLSGVLAVACYLGGVWYAVANGVPAGVSGLIAATQPLLTALLAPVFLAERISARQWVGIGFASFGILLVLQPKLASVAPAELAAVKFALLLNLAGMVAITLASIHQKRFLVGTDMRTLTPVQLASSFVVTLPVAYLTEPMRLEWNAVTIGVMVWSVLVLSIGGGLLYFIMIRAGQVSKVAALIYLVPLAVALQAYALFGETMVPWQIAGMLVTTIGVALAMKRG